MSEGVYIPDNPALIGLLGGLPRKLRHYADHGLLLLHFIASKRWLGDVDRHGFARLNWRILRGYIHGSALGPLKRRFADAGAIETDPYSAGRRSTGYRIGPNFDGPPRRVLLRDAPLCRKLREFRQQYGKGLKPPPAAVLERRADILGRMRHSLDRLGFVWPVDQTIAQAVRQGVDPGHAGYVCQAILNGDHDGLTVDAFGYRVHSIVTRAAREIRQQLTLDGAPLVELDVGNSQPLLLAAALQAPQHWTTYVELRAMSSDGQHSGRCAPAPPALLLSGVDTQELRALTELCETAELYDVLKRAGRFPDTETTKKRLFAVLYGRPGGRPSTMARTLVREWPTCFAAVDAMKRAYGYKTTSQVLQRLESAVMIDGVCGRLIREDLRAGFLTVHDSLLVHAQHAERARRIMAEEFAKAGVRAVIRRKKVQKGELTIDKQRDSA